MVILRTWKFWTKNTEIKQNKETAQLPLKLKRSGKIWKFGLWAKLVRAMAALNVSSVHSSSFSRPLLNLSGVSSSRNIPGSVPKNRLFVTARVGDFEVGRRLKKYTIKKFIQLEIIKRCRGQSFTLVSVERRCCLKVVVVSAVPDHSTALGSKARCSGDGLTSGFQSNEYPPASSWWLRSGSLRPEVRPGEERRHSSDRDSTPCPSFRALGV